MKLKNIIKIGSFVVAGVAPMTSSTASASDYMCLACPAGTYSNGGSTSCTPCPAGTYSNAVATNCTKCPIGTYSSGGAGNCTNCPTGYPTKSTGSTSEKDCEKPCYESITLYKGSCSSNRPVVDTVKISCYQSVKLNGKYSTSGSSAFSCKQKCTGRDDKWCSYVLSGGSSYSGTYTNVDGTMESFINSKQ